MRIWRSSWLKPLGSSSLNRILDGPVADEVQIGGRRNFGTAGGAVEGDRTWSANGGEHGTAELGALWCTGVVECDGEPTGGVCTVEVVGGVQLRSSTPGGTGLVRLARR